MQEGYWVTRTYVAGDIGEKTKFFVPGKRPTGKTRRLERREIRKQEQNSYNAQKTLARLLNANFTEGGLLLGLDYCQDGYGRMLEWGRKNGLPVDSENMPERMDAVWEAADHALELCLRRVKRKLQKDGLELKAVYITSDMDGQTGESVRVHHHLVVNAEAKDAFLEAWEKYGLGGVSYEELWKRSRQQDRTPIAEYFIRQVRRIPDAKKYRSTRNLVRPQPRDRATDSGSPLQVPRGGEMLYVQEYRRGEPQYIRYITPAGKKRMDSGQGVADG